MTYIEHRISKSCFSLITVWCLPSRSQTTVCFLWLHMRLINHCFSAVAGESWWTKNAIGDFRLDSFVFCPGVYNQSLHDRILLDEYYSIFWILNLFHAVKSESLAELTKSQRRLVGMKYLHIQAHRAQKLQLWFSDSNHLLTAWNF